MCLHQINLQRFCGMDLRCLPHVFRAWLFLIKSWSIVTNQSQTSHTWDVFQWLVPSTFGHEKLIPVGRLHHRIEKISGAPPRESPSSARRSAFVSTSSSYLVELNPNFSYGKLWSRSSHEKKHSCLWSWLFYPIFIIIIYYRYNNI